MTHDADPDRPPPLPPLPADFLVRHDQAMADMRQQLDEWIITFRVRVKDNGGDVDRATLEFVAAMATQVTDDPRDTGALTMTLATAVAIARLAEL